MNDMKSFVDALQDEIKRLNEENRMLKTHAPYGILTRAAFEIEKRKVKHGQYVVFGDIDRMHEMNTQYGYEVVNEKIREALQIRSGDLLLTSLYFSGDEIIFVINGDPQGFCNRIVESFRNQELGITLAFASIPWHGSIDKAIEVAASNVQAQKRNRK